MELFINIVTTFMLMSAFLSLVGVLYQVFKKQPTPLPTVNSICPWPMEWKVKGLHTAFRRRDYDNGEVFVELMKDNDNTLLSTRMPSMRDRQQIAKTKVS